MGLLDDILTIVNKPGLLNHYKPSKKDWLKDDPEMLARARFEEEKKHPGCCRNPNCRRPTSGNTEIGADGASHVCKSCGTEVSLFLCDESEWLIRADDANGGEDKKRAEAVLDTTLGKIMCRLPLLYQIESKLTKGQKWQRLRIEQVTVWLQIMHMQLEDLQIKHDEFNEAIERLCYSFAKLGKDYIPSAGVKGSPVLWAIVMLRDMHSRREGGFTAPDEAVQLRYSTWNLHNRLSHLASMAQHLVERADMRRQRYGNVIKNDKKKHLRWEELGDHVAQIRKINFLDSLLKNGSENFELEENVKKNLPPPLRASTIDPHRKKRKIEEVKAKLIAGYDGHVVQQKQKMLDARGEDGFYGLEPVGIHVEPPKPDPEPEPEKPKKKKKSVASAPAPAEEQMDVEMAPVNETDDNEDTEETVNFSQET